MQAEIIRLQGSLTNINLRFKYQVEELDRKQKRLVEIEQEKADLVKVVGLIDRAIVVISANGVGKIESLVTSGLQLVLNDPTLALKIVKDETARGNSYSLEGVMGEVSGPLMDTFGGAMWNVVAFLLRVLLIKRFNLAKVLVVDEAFNNVSVEHQPMVSEMLRDLTQHHGYTILAITHQPILAAAADRVYRVVPHTNQSPTLELLTADEHEELRERAVARTPVSGKSKELSDSLKETHLSPPEDRDGVETTTR